MAGLSENTISVIKQDDPNLPEYLDFKKLRKEGLNHIGNLSGKIWTDHNAHDPGITILEVLVYALMDLGYKTNLPFEDLIAQQDKESKDDNFLTPLEILTINPVTITDYRKLLLEIEGVKNAWLEPVGENQGATLYIDEDTSTLKCLPDKPNTNPAAGTTTSAADNREECYSKIHLNGLYKVYIEKDTNIILDSEQDNRLIEEVGQLLNKHRNLCEDFLDINVLRSINFGVCVDIELHTGYKAEKIYAEVIKKLKNFIQPEIKYYTLNELLDKGKSIDDIFAGRPYREESYGFVDTEEFEKLERRKEFHLSDIYNVILSIEGVRKVKKVHLKKGNGDPSCNWVEGNNIPDGGVPVFSLEETCVDLYTEDGVLKFDKTRIHNTFSFGKKFALPLENLDTKVPSGKYRDDLKEYYSIQNDFPVVYGIGDDGLPERSTLLRKTQALQLKGYLMFYDQMLANYTSQLTNIRSLFSLKAEKERNVQEKHTYFTQDFEEIDIKRLKLDELLRFYDKGENKDEGSVLALPVPNNAEWKEALEKLKSNPRTEFTISGYCEDKEGVVDLLTFPSPNIRSIFINQLIDSFFSQKYTVEILQDRYGYFFVLCPDIPDDVLIIGTKRYKSTSEAKKEASNVVFIATISENYNLTTNKSEDSSSDQHYFGITHHPVSYMNLIQEITENKDEYVIRRQQFLDHLLARFGEEFTDYTLLQYQNKISKSVLKDNKINDQSLYVNEFAEISRNRGKAFNYLEPSWNTNNVSGFEKRISLLSGMNNYKRHNLCNFEVIPCYKMELRDYNGQMFFRSNRSYETKNELNKAAKKVLSKLRDPEAYKHLEKNLNGFDARVLMRLFSEKAGDENIKDIKFNYKQQLINSDQIKVVDSKNIKMRSEKIANETKGDFIKNMNSDKQTFLEAAGEKKKYRLLPVDNNCYLDTAELKMRSDEWISWKWHVNELITKEKSACSQVFEKEAAAWDHMVNEANLDSYLTKHDVALKWKLHINEDISFNSTSYYPDAYKAIAVWRQGKTLGSLAKNYDFVENDNSLVIQLKGEKGNVIAVSNKIKKDECNQKTVVDECIKVFADRKTKPDYEKEKGKFGFKIPAKENLPSLESYCAYDSKKEALQEIGKVFELGENKKNYLQSGDEGNPEYNFILKDKYDSFLALPPDHFEIATDRNKALNAITRFLKKNELPVSVVEEPRRYTWALLEEEKEMLKSDSEFSTRAKSQANFDKAVVAEVLKGNQKMYQPHLYDFKVESTPVEFNFVYGTSRNSENEFDPIFVSSSVYKSKEEAKIAYSDFVRKLPGLTLKPLTKKGSAYEFALYGSDKKNPIAIQYKGEAKASYERAKELTTYINQIYTTGGDSRDAFIDESMAENQEGQYEWRFYKKNLPLAKNPFPSDDMASANDIKAMICDVIPPINLKNCPPNKTVVKLSENAGKYHYQICFKDDKENNLVLNSYVGYESYEEAEDAWKKEWIDVIEIAKNREEYVSDGKININEVYKDPESNACNEASFIAVIPKVIKEKIESEENRNLVEYYVSLAKLFPIYKMPDGTSGNSKYKFKVMIPPTENSNGETQPSERLIWEGTDCYNNYEEAISAYQYFYRLAGTSNNCRVLCEKGKLYVTFVEVLAESSCQFETEKQAWDDMFTRNKDSCENCIPGGVREFTYAAEDAKNYIYDCSQEYWKFKVVSPKYFTVDHNCWYNSETERDIQKRAWEETNFKRINWDKERSIFETEKGFYYRVYFPENEPNITEIGLQPCGCGEESANDTENTCKEIYPFISSNYYSCKSEAEDAFDAFKRLISNSEKPYVLENISKSDHGPYSFQIIDNNDEMVIACHPQQYDSVQEVKDAIIRTKACVDDEGIHLLEHILLRPNNSGECEINYFNENRETINVNCLLPICPDYKCEIPWQPDMEKDDPCAESDLDKICYLPGSDPYSFWATVVLPAWGKRFRTQESRQAFESFLYKEVPALVGLNILWLSPWDMCKFEDEYKNWMEWKQDPTPPYCDFNIGYPSCQLSNYIRDFKSELLCPTKLGEQGECNCKNNEQNSSDECCLPHNTTGTIFWGECVAPYYIDPGYDGEGTTGISLEGSINSPLEGHAIAAKTKGAKKIVTTTKTKSKTKLTAKAKSITTKAKVKKETKKTVVKNEPKQDVLALVRQRKPKYISNIKAIANDSKSYERIEFFLKNTPTVPAYTKLVDFFIRYSLQKDNNNKDFLTLIKNATWHLLDNLVLEKKGVLKKETITVLNKNITALSKKGLSKKDVNRYWKIDEVKALTNTKKLNQIKQLLK